MMQTFMMQTFMMQTFMMQTLLVQTLRIYHGANLENLPRSEILIFKDAKTFANISEDTRTAWIKDGFSYMIDHPNEKSYSVRSGNALVLFEREEDGFIAISDCTLNRVSERETGYRDMDIDDDDDDDDDDDE